MASGECTPNGILGVLPPLGLGAGDCLPWAQRDVWVLLSLKEKQGRPLMTPSHPSDRLSGLRLVDPTKLSSPGKPERILSPLPPRVQSPPIKQPKQCGLCPASLTSLACKTFPAKQAAFFAGGGEKEVCNFPDLAIALERIGKGERTHFQKQTGPGEQTRSIQCGALR